MAQEAESGFDGMFSQLTSQMFGNWNDCIRLFAQPWRETTINKRSKLVAGVTSGAPAKQHMLCDILGNQVWNPGISLESSGFKTAIMRRKHKRVKPPASEGCIPKVSQEEVASCCAQVVCIVLCIVFCRWHICYYILVHSLSMYCLCSIITSPAKYYEKVLCILLGYDKKSPSIDSLWVGTKPSKSTANLRTAVCGTEKQKNRGTFAVLRYQWTV